MDDFHDMAPHRSGCLHCLLLVVVVLLFVIWFIRHGGHGEEVEAGSGDVAQAVGQGGSERAQARRCA